MKLLSLYQAQQVAGGLSIHTQGKTIEISNEGLSEACIQALPSIMTSTYNFSGLTGSPCSEAELSLFQKRYHDAVFGTLNKDRTFQHKQRITFPLRRH